ncbi:MAG: hypothetical protein ACYCW6_10795 [Candidatus Xenobia bacterium]
MRHRIAFIALCLIALALPVWADPAAGGGAAPAAAPNGVSDAAAACHNFFSAVNSRDYGTAWKLLSHKSQDSLIDGVVKSDKIDQATVRQMFDSNDERLQRGFWDSFRESSKAVVYASADYRVESVKGDEAKVSFGKNGDTAPTKLLAYHEADGWKFGLMETFFPQGLPDSGG